MLHRRSVPAIVGFDPYVSSEGPTNRYGWAQELAKDNDVSVMELQGSGRSPRPKTDDA